MAGTLWSTPVGPFGGSEDIAVGKSALGWRHFGREAAGEGVHRVQAVFTSRRPAAGSERAWTTDTSLFLVLLTVAPDMQIRLHTAPTDMTPLKTYASGPALDPGGTNMAYLETREPGNESDRRRVVVLSLPGFLNATLAGSTEKQRTFGPEPGYKRTLFPEWDRSPSSLSWSESGLWMAVEEHARVRAFLAPAPIPLPGSAEDEGPEPLRISHKGAARNLLPLPPIVLRAARPGPGGPPDFDTESLEVHRAFGFRSRAHEPDEGWVFWMARRETGMPGDGSGKPEVRLERGGRRMTDLHAGKLAGIALPEPEGFKFRSHGSEVHAWSFRPANHTPEHKAWPLAVLIHGGPEGAWTDSWGGRWNYQCFTGAGWWVIAINPRGSTGYGQRFTDAVRKDWGGRPYDDLMKGVDEALARFPVDAGRTVALGASYGGFMINWINGHTERFRALVCHDGLFSSFMNYYATDELFFPESEFGGAPFSNAAARLRYEEFNPERFVGRWRTPTLVVHGERDYRLGVEQGIAAFTALRRRGVPARLVLFPDENHWVLRPVNLQRWYAEVLGWIGRHGLGPRAQAPG
ncbi:Alpha/Beta hydrolase protein [Hyaloraphidium curvatum]|nr:Alpha/Beta hydrolase protein [Hyaloraphidium curvatum]